MSSNFRQPKMPSDRSDFDSYRRDEWEDYDSRRRAAKKKMDRLATLIVVVFLLTVTAAVLALYMIRRGTPGEPAEDTVQLATLSSTESPTVQLATLPTKESPTEQPTMPPIELPTVPPTLPPTAPPTLPPTEPPIVVPTVPPTIAPAETTDRVVQTRQCYVISGIGELNIRSGPGTDYPQVGRLNEGTPVTILETVQSGSTQWGRVTRGWVNMGYITDSAPSAATAGTQVRVKASAGELRIRSGPGTNYDWISSLQAGQIVTVTETQNVNGMQWGHITQGWISMDYVETVPSTAPAAPSADTSGGGKFLGPWQDELGMRCSLWVYAAGDDSYTVEFSWSSGASNTTHWRAYGTYDQETDSIYYGGCRSWTTIYGDDGSYQEITHYTEGTGRLYFSGDYLYWQDDEENEGARCRFTQN